MLQSIGSQRVGHDSVTERQQLRSAVVDLEAQSLSKGWTFHGFAMSDILETAGGVSVSPEQVPDGTDCPPWQIWDQAVPYWTCRPQGIWL